MCSTKIKPLRNFTMLKNCVHVKLASCKATKKATMEDEETTSISTSDGWRSNLNYTSSCVMELKRQIWTNGTVPTMTIDILSASWWNTCKIQQTTIFVSWNVVLCSAEYFRYNPRFGIASLQYACHLSVGCMRKRLLDWHTMELYYLWFYVL